MDGIELLKKDSQILVFFEDEGPGLQPSKENQIFDLFYWERPTNEEFGIHLGLGLSISKQIIRAHEGSIRADNIQGNLRQVLRACVIVNLPEAQ